MSNTNTTAKITKKDNLNSIIALVAAAEAAGVEGNYDFPALVAYCENEIGLLDKKAAKAKEKAAEKKTELDELCEVVKSVLTAEFQTRQEIADQIAGDDVSVAKVGARLTKLVNAEIAEKAEISVPGADGKNRKVMGYRLFGSVDAE